VTIDPQDVILAAADKLEPELRQAFLDAFASLTVDVEAVAAAIQAGDVNAVLNMLPPLQIDPAPIRAALTAAADAAAEATAGMMGMTFTGVNPATVRWIDQYSVQLLSGIDADSDIARAVRAIIRQGAEGQWDVRDQARLIERLVPLTRRDATAVANFAAGFDELTDTAQRFIDAYARRLLRARAETIARTETIRAANRGTIDLWVQARDDGVLPPDARQVWIVTPDDRLCSRCAEMEGLTVDVAGAWSEPPGGLGATTREPPLHPRCRCTTGLVFD